MSADYLGEFEQMVLLTVLRLGEGAFGLAIMDEMESTAQRRPSSGALYTTLDRLERKGLLRAAEGEATPGRGGRRRRYVSVTPEGQRLLASSRSRLIALWDGIEEALT